MKTGTIDGHTGPDHQESPDSATADLKWRELAQKTPECRDRQQGFEFSVARLKLVVARPESGILSLQLGNASKQFFNLSP